MALDAARALLADLVGEIRLERVGWRRYCAMIVWTKLGSSLIELADWSAELPGIDWGPEDVA